MSTRPYNAPASMPEALGEIYNELDHLIVWLHIQWKMYRQVFGTSKERIDLINECAGGFFRICQDSIFDEVRLELCRLTDPAKSGRYDNLTLETLVNLIDSKKHPELAKNVTKLYDKVKKTCKSFRDWRNRRGAHRDLETSLNRHALPLPEASRQMIEDALKSLDALMNAILDCFEPGTTRLFSAAHILGDGDDLIRCLEMVRTHGQEERRRMGFE